MSTEQMPGNHISNNIMQVIIWRTQIWWELWVQCGVCAEIRTQEGIMGSVWYEVFGFWRFPEGIKSLLSLRR